MQLRRKRLATIVVSMLVLAMVLAISFSLVACNKKDDPAPEKLEGEDIIHEALKGTDGTYKLDYDNSPMSMGAKCFASYAFIEKVEGQYYLTLYQTKKKYMGMNVIENMRIKTTDASGEELIISAELVPYEEAYKHIFPVTEEMLTNTMSFIAYIPAKPTSNKDIHFDLNFDMTKTEKVSEEITPELKGVLEAK